MTKPASFRVDPRLTAILGESYASSERALRELIVSVIRHSAFVIPNGLFLAGNILKQHLLIEFKRPSETVGRDAEAQAKKYADTLTGRSGMSLQILIIGGNVDPKLQDEYTGKKTSFAAYRAVIASAR